MNMNDHTHNEYADIRGMLARYYDGIASQTEIGRLEEFFSCAAPLPADLEADKVLFRSMSGLSAEPVDIPAELSDRISAALDAEIAGDSTGREPKASRHSAWRRRLLVAVAAAACLTAVVTTFRTLIDMPEMIPAQPGGTIASAVDTARRGNPSPSLAAAEDTLVMAIAPDGLAARAEKPGSVRRGNRRAARSAGASARHDAEPTDENTSVGYPSYANAEVANEMPDYTPEEERMIAANYRVVDDEREAYAIVNSIFSRLEGNMMREDRRLDVIDDNYDMEVSRISY